MPSPSAEDDMENRDQLIEGILNRLASAEDFDDIKWILGETIVTAVQKKADQVAQANTTSLGGAGLNTVIKRIPLGDCCDWCWSVAGIHSYPVDREIYRRHTNCQCSVIYDPQNAKYKVQNVYTKEKFDTEVRALEESMKEYGLTKKDVWYTYKARDLKLSNITDVSKEYAAVKPAKAESVVIPSDYDTNLHAVETEEANWLSKRLGTEIELLAESAVPGKKTADYLIDGTFWELKSISTGKAADSALRKALKQISEKPGGIILRCANKDITMDEVLDHIEKRIKRGVDFDFDIVITQDEEITAALRYKK